ncbi:MAG: ChbG/HpnK family deacetylase, partial [Elusimicrobia bacterium]|nr:ChbG/HpnK family deacetylase [Elusimicrobiota bacterium]
REGILTHASLMVDRPQAAEAVRLAKENPGLGVGLHVELCADNPGAWGMRYFFLREHRRRIEPEIRRQIEKFLASGLTPTHIDSHFHIHVHPVIFPILARLAREYKIPRTRLPGGEYFLCLRYSREQAVSRGVLAAGFFLLGRALKSFGRGLEIPKRCYGLLRSGLMKKEYVRWLVKHAPAGTAEIYLHLCDDPATRTDGAPTETHYSIDELEALLDDEVRRAMSESLGG